MTVKEYAQALDILFQEEPRGTLGKEFVDHLKKNGKMGLLPAIVRTLDKIVEKRARAMICEVIAATEKEQHGAILHAKTFLSDEGAPLAGWTFLERVDPSLIGGYIIRTPERELDMSDKRGLYRLYERLRTVS